MILLVGVIGLILIISAIRNSQAALFTALKADVPDYIVWAAAIFAVGCIGYVKELRPVSRGLLGLVILVIVLKNYNGVIAGFQNAWQHPGVSTAPTGDTAAPSATSGAVSGAADKVGGILGNYIGNGLGDMLSTDVSGGGGDVFGASGFGASSVSI